MSESTDQVTFRVEMCSVGHFYPQMLIENEKIWKPINCFFCLQEGFERLKQSTQKLLKPESP